MDPSCRSVTPPGASGVARTPSRNGISLRLASLQHPHCILRRILRGRGLHHHAPGHVVLPPSRPPRRARVIRDVRRSRGHCAGIDRGRCRHVTVAVGYATPPHPSGGTWGRLGHFRGVPRGSHGEKCSLSEQKGEMNIKRGHFWTKLAKFGRNRRNSAVLSRKRPFLADRRTDGRTETFQLSELGYLKFRSTRI
jgi:hypothetical protein